MNKEYYALWDTENNRFVTADEAIKAGADETVANGIYPHLFSKDDSELVYHIHDCCKTGEWEVVPVNVEININITKK
jgi:hypothetical protein